MNFSGTLVLVFKAGTVEKEAELELRFWSRCSGKAVAQQIEQGI